MAKSWAVLWDLSARVLCSVNNCVEKWGCGGEKECSGLLQVVEHSIYTLGSDLAAKSSWNLVPSFLDKCIAECNLGIRLTIVPANP